jgi:hypothetical protein
MVWSAIDMNPLCAAALLARCAWLFWAAPLGEVAGARINAGRAWQYVQDFVAIGSRKPGSDGHQKAIDFIHAALKRAGVDYEDDRFRARTPVGSFDLRNIIAKIPGTKEGIIVVASHFETNYPLPERFVGANDGGSTTGLLLEFAHVLKPKAGPRREGASIYLVFDDGEEAFKDWYKNHDHLYGTEHLAAKWKADGTLKNIKGLFVLDMLGDRQLDVTRDTNSTPWMEDLVYAAARLLGYQSHFFATQVDVEDDHLPFARLGVPVADVIDLNYGSGNSLHHTVEDTLDKLSPESLKIAGDTVLLAIALLEDRAPRQGAR